MCQTKRNPLASFDENMHQPLWLQDYLNLKTLVNVFITGNKFNHQGEL